MGKWHLNPRRDTQPSLQTTFAKAYSIPKLGVCKFTNTILLAPLITFCSSTSIREKFSNALVV